MLIRKDATVIVGKHGRTIKRAVLDFVNGHTFMAPWDRLCKLCSGNGVEQYSCSYLSLEIFLFIKPSMLYVSSMF